MSTLEACDTSPYADNASAIKHSKVLANKVFSTLWDPVVFPVDPVKIASKAGIKVIEAGLPPEVSGALIKKIGLDPIVYLEASDSRQRKRFSCAHELGHYYSRVDQGEDGPSYEYVDLRDQSSASGTDLEEVFANNFAANLLMPEDYFRKAYEHFGRVGLSRFFAVSDSAILVRSKFLKLN